MSEYDWPGCTHDSVLRTDPESRPYIQITPSRTANDHWRAGTRLEPGDLLEFQVEDRVYRGVLVGIDLFGDEDEYDRVYVRMTNAPSYCGGCWGASKRFRVVQSPGPRVRSLGRGYTGARPRGGLAATLVDE